MAVLSTQLTSVYWRLPQVKAGGFFMAVLFAMKTHDAIPLTVCYPIDFMDSIIFSIHNQFILSSFRAVFLQVPDNSTNIACIIRLSRHIKLSLESVALLLLLLRLSSREGFLRSWGRVSQNLSLPLGRPGRVATCLWHCSMGFPLINSKNHSIKSLFVRVH